MNTTRYYLVTFKTDSLDLTEGYGDTHGREFDTREEAEAFVANLHGAGDAYDVEIEEVNPNTAAEMVMVQFGPAL